MQPMSGHELQKHINKKRRELINEHRRHENLEKMMIELNKQRIREEEALKNKYEKLFKPFYNKQSNAFKKRKNALENMVTYGQQVYPNPQNTIKAQSLRERFAARRIASMLGKHIHTILAANYVPGGPAYNRAHQRFLAGAATTQPLPKIEPSPHRGAVLALLKMSRGPLFPNSNSESGKRRRF